MINFIVVMNLIKYNNYYFIQKNNLNNVPEETEGLIIKEVKGSIRNDYYG